MEATTMTLDRIIEDHLAAALAPGNYSMNLSQDAFNPRTIEDFNEADFLGYAGKAFTTVNNGVNAADGKRTLNFTPPAGGFKFTAHANLTVPQTVHGFIIKNVDEDYIVGGELFPEPINVNAPGKFVMVGLAQLSLRNDAM